MNAEKVRSEITLMLDLLAEAKKNLTDWAEKTFPVGSPIHFPYYSSQKIGRVRSCKLHENGYLELAVDYDRTRCYVMVPERDVYPATEEEFQAQEEARLARQARRR